MKQHNLILQTKLTPPRLHKRTLPRPRLTQAISEAEAHRLTILQAGTGYSKSTTLSVFANQVEPVAWYHLSNEDSDPLVFLFHLYYACAATWPNLSETPLVILEDWERNSTQRLWSAAVDALCNALSLVVKDRSFLVIDDAHLLNNSGQTLLILDRFIGRTPVDFHVILSTRYPLDLPTLITWRVRNEVLEIGQNDLAFTQKEVAALFSQRYELELSADQVAFLAERVEGWPIALPLVWQRILGPSQLSITQALGQITGTTSELFHYLAQEVLQQQPPDVYRFLQITSVLRQMTPAICDQLRDKDDSAQILRYLLENGLFIVDLGNGYSRYHHLFRDLLRHQLPEDEAIAAHLRAAAGCQERGEAEQAIYHLLSASAFEKAAVILDSLGRRMVRAGRLDTLEGWIGALPPDCLANHPTLLVCLGDIARLHSRFDEALRWYQQAEERSRALADGPGIGQALRGQARTYLDTLNPSMAERLLQEALRLADGQEDRESRARLLDLLAENMVNQGRFKEAENYQAEAHQLRHEGPGEAELPVRLLLRTGQLQKARLLLEQQVEEELRQPVRRPRAHRETQLLLSLVLAFQGEREPAYQCAIAGTERGQTLNSPFVTAVGHMRQGHSWLLGKNEVDYDQARHCFQEAIRLSETLDVPRLKVEANWGLCQAHGFGGDLDMARQAAEQGIAIARAFGDAWIEGSLRLVFGASLTLAKRFDEAAGWLSRADATFAECGDTYGQAVSRLWLCLVWQATGDTARLARDVDNLLQQVQTHRYTYLLQRKTLLGPPDPHALVPLLLFARQTSTSKAYAGQLLGQLGLGTLEYHPGYQLRLNLLGSFSASRGSRTIGPTEWKRKKARQLFQLLLSNRKKLLEREQITDTLWPELEPEVASRDFKIANSTLCRILEPGHQRNTPSAFIVRVDTLYGLRPEADIWMDVIEFESFIAQGDSHFEQNVEEALPFYRQALALYVGEYLQELRYEEWCIEERERLHGLYLRTADRLARTLVAKESWEEAIEVCQAILGHDDCWEQAYRLMMISYARLGNQAQAIRTFQRCEERLQSELGVSPSAITWQVYQEILGQIPRRESSSSD